MQGDRIVVHVDFRKKAAEKIAVGDILQELNEFGKFVTLVAVDDKVIVSVILQSKMLKRMEESPEEFAAAFASIQSIRHVKSETVWNVLQDEPVAVSPSTNFSNAVRLTFRSKQWSGSDGRKFFGRIEFE